VGDLFCRDVISFDVTSLKKSAELIRGDKHICGVVAIPNASPAVKVTLV
jgi:hypothetical protein